MAYPKSKKPPNTPDRHEDGDAPTQSPTLPSSNVSLPPIVVYSKGHGGLGDGVMDAGNNDTGVMDTVGVMDDDGVTPGLPVGVLLPDLDFEAVLVGVTDGTAGEAVGLGDEDSLAASTGAAEDDTVEVLLEDDEGVEESLGDPEADKDAAGEADSLPVDDTLCIDVPDGELVPVGDQDVLEVGLSDGDGVPVRLLLDVDVTDPLSDTDPVGLSLRDADGDGDTDSLVLPLALLLSLTLPLLDGDHDTLPVADGVDDTHAPVPVCTRTHSTPTAPVSTLPLTLLTKLTLTLAPLCTTSTSKLCTVSEP